MTPSVSILADALRRALTRDSSMLGGWAATAVGTLIVGLLTCFVGGVIWDSVACMLQTQEAETAAEVAHDAGHDVAAKEEEAPPANRPAPPPRADSGQRDSAALMAALPVAEPSSSLSIATRSSMLLAPDVANLGAAIDAAHGRELALFADVLGERADAWHLVCNIDQGVAKVLRRSDRARGDFVLRVLIPNIPGEVHQILAFGLEMDLMPTWNKFAAWGGILHRVTFRDLYLATTSKMPLLVPNHNILLRATCLDLMKQVGCMVFFARRGARAETRRDCPITVDCPANTRREDRAAGSAGLPLDSPLVPHLPFTYPHMCAQDAEGRQLRKRGPALHRAAPARGAVEPRAL